MKKINRTQAEKLYNAGKTIKVLPCKMNPENIWQKPMEINITEHDETDKDIANRHGWTLFDMTINAFEAYNCNNETGKYAAFYIDV